MMQDRGMRQTPASDRAVDPTITQGFCPGFQYRRKWCLEKTASYGDPATPLPRDRRWECRMRNGRMSERAFGRTVRKTSKSLRLPGTSCRRQGDLEFRVSIIRRILRADCLYKVGHRSSNRKLGSEEPRRVPEDLRLRYTGAPKARRSFSNSEFRMSRDPPGRVFGWSTRRSVRIAACPPMRPPMAVMFGCG